MRKAELCCGFPRRPRCILRQIYQTLFISIRTNSCWLAEFFIFTGRQGVCVVPMETPASGKSRLDPGCQFGGWAVSRYIFQIATWEAQYPEKFLYLTSEEKYVWKSFKGCLRHLGHSTGVTTESGADADLSLLIPGLAVQPWKPF